MNKRNILYFGANKYLLLNINNEMYNVFFTCKINLRLNDYLSFVINVINILNDLIKGSKILTTKVSWSSLGLHVQRGLPQIYCRAIIKRNVERKLVYFHHFRRWEAITN